MPQDVHPARLTTGPATSPQPRRAKHLIDPNAPRPVRDAAAAQRSLTSVQRWVMSALAVTTILHLSVGISIAAMFLDRPQLSAQIGLNVIAAAFGVVAIAAGFAIHGRRLLTPWLLLGTIPGLVGLWLTLR